LPCVQVRSAMLWGYTTPMKTLVWFRHDLRTADHPALYAAAARGSVVPVYLRDATLPSTLVPGGASRWWLHHSLTALSESLGGLVLHTGDPRALVLQLAQQYGCTHVVWSRAYTLHERTRDEYIKKQLTTEGITVESFNGTLLHEPWEVHNKSGSNFKVFTPFWKTAALQEVHAALPAVRPTLALSPDTSPSLISEKLSDWNLLPTSPDWSTGFTQRFIPGEVGALARLTHFLDTGITGYKELRNRPDLPHTSELSPHLAFGELSPRTIWHTVHARMAAGTVPTPDALHFLSEVGWREFSYSLLYHYPTLATHNWKPAFDAYPWRDRDESASDLHAWQRGTTGYALVDAGMRELWHTGFMHNRVRMVCASFLTKHIRIHWNEGERWFWDTLLDADPANNSASWQWVAGSGADAAPYYRIFNPIEQGRKFDPDATYIKKWCPERAHLIGDAIFEPINPIVEHSEARTAALAAYAQVQAAAPSIEN
jgi:deoxyribodipyrimidine photo-lyase